MAQVEQSPFSKTSVITESGKDLHGNAHGGKPFTTCYLLTEDGETPLCDGEISHSHSDEKVYHHL